MAYKPKYDFDDSFAADKDADSAERLANAQSRLTEAEIKMAENRAISTPRMMELRQEQTRNGAMNDVFAAARQRRLDSQRMTAIADPGRYAPSVRQEALDWQRTGGLRAHELAVADKGIEQERVKAWGMANQGGVAAGIKAGVERDANRSQHGYFDENGNYVPGSTVRAAEATGLSRTELENMRSENRMAQILAQENGRDRRQQQQIEAGREKTDAWREEKGLDRQANKEKADARTGRIKERQAQTDAMREQRDFEAFERSVGGVVNNPLTPEQKKEYRALKTPEERKAWWKSHFGRGDQQPQDGKPKDGDRKQFKQGWGTWKDGKWVLDAQ